MRLALLLLLGLATAARASGPLPDTSIPGPYGVGLTTVTFTKTSVVSGLPRPLETLVWYPAVPGTGTADQGVQRDALALRRHFPLVIFSHGSCGAPADSSFLTTALASWGFVVAAPAHPGNLGTDGFPACFLDGNTRTERPADVGFVIESMLAESRKRGSRFSRSISPRRVGIAGHSLGAGTVIVVAGKNPRVRAALAMAPARREVVADAANITVPTMIQGAELDPIAPFEIEVRPVYDNLAAHPRFLVELFRTGHLAFADVCQGIFVFHTCDPDKLTQAEAHRFVLRFAVPFFLRYLAHQPWVTPLLVPTLAPPGTKLQAAN